MGGWRNLQSRIEGPDPRAAGKREPNHLPDITHPGRELIWCADPEVHAALRKLDFTLQTVPLSGMSQVRQQNLLSFFM